MRIEKNGVKSKNVCFPYVLRTFLVRGGSAESRRGIRSILKVDENPCARSNILAGGKKQKKTEKKTEKILKIEKMMKMRWGAERCPQVVQNKAFGEGPKSPRAALQRSEVKFRQKMEFLAVSYTHLTLPTILLV